MTTVNTTLTNFTSGELSPKVYGRSDLAAYFNGARRLENFIAQKQGPAIFRGGTQFVAETKDGNKAFLFKFQFSDEVSYVLEFTNLNFRVYKDRGIIAGPVDVTTPYLESELFELKFAQNATDLYVVHPKHQPRKISRTSDTAWTIAIHAPTGVIPPFNSQSITNITQANPAVVTYSGADNFANGGNVRIDNVVGMTEVNGLEFVVANVNTGANTFELSGINSTGFGAYVSGGDVYIVDNCPGAVAFYEERLIYAGSAANPETLWFSKSADVDDFTIGTGATDGIKYTVAASQGVSRIEWLRGSQESLVIGGFGDVLNAAGGDINSAIAPDNISIKATNTAGVADQNPVGANQALLYFIRNQRTMFSFELNQLSGRFEPTDLNLLADHITTSGINQIVQSEGRPDIIWGVRGDGDLVGATLESGQEVTAWHRHSTDGKFISVATTPRVKEFDTTWFCIERTVNGSLTHHIEFLNDNIEFPRREDFVTDEDNQISDDDTFQRALLEAQKEYIHVDNAATFDGVTRGVDAGATLTIGAVTGSSVLFTASAAVFTSGDVGNEIWVKSTDGTRFGRGEIVAFNSTTTVDVDITVDFDSTDIYPIGEWYITASVITGLDNLEGLTVSVVTDGSVHPPRTVSSNQITLESEASVVHVGLPFTGTVETMDLEGGGTTGPAQTKKKSLYKVGMRLLDTSGLKFGSDYYTLEDRLLREATDLMDNPPPLRTGDEVIRFDDGGDEGWDREKRVIAQQSLPLPASIQLIVPYFTVSNND